MIRIQDLLFAYGTLAAPSDRRVILDGISLEIPSGQFWGVLGANGSGKSTLAKCLDALLLPQAGCIRVDGLDTQVPTARTALRQIVGLVLQNPDNQLIASCVEEDLAFGLEQRCRPSEEIQRKVEEGLRAVQLFEKRLASPEQLSGGEKQRLVLAAMLILDLRYLILDESTAMLDPRSRQDLLKLLKKLRQERGFGLLLITHQAEELLEADQIILLDHGRLAAQGRPREIFANLEQLHALNLEAPPLTELAAALHQRGLPLKLPVLSKEEMADELCRIYAES